MQTAAQVTKEIMNTLSLEGADTVGRLVGEVVEVWAYAGLGGDSARMTITGTVDYNINRQEFVVRNGSAALTFKASDIVSVEDCYGSNFIGLILKGG